MSQLINAGFNHIVIYPQGNGGINMNLNIISNLANGSNSNDAVNLSQLQSVQSSIPTKLSDLSVLNTANINLNSNKIINVVDPVNAQDVSTKNYVDTKVSSVVVPTKLSDLTGSNTSNLNLNSNKINNVVDPVSAQDAATKNYVDTKVASGGSTLTQTLNTTAYTGSLYGVYCKILWMTNNSSYIPNIINLNNIINNLNGNSSNIIINTIINVDSSTVLTYDSSYDVVIWTPGNNGSYPNLVSLLNTYYSNGKGVVFSMFATSSGLSLTKNISTSNNQLTSFTGTYTQSNTSHPILKGCTTLVNPTYANSVFNSQNGSTIIGLFGGSTGVVAYLDDNTLGRRVDLNYLAGDGYYVTGDTTLNGLNRLTLQALLWAGRKINSASTTTSNFDPNNMQLVSNLNCNNKNIINCSDPINLQDVVSLNYLNNFKPSGVITNIGYTFVGNCYNSLSVRVGLITSSISSAYHMIAQFASNRNTVLKYIGKYDGIFSSSISSGPTIYYSNPYSSDIGTYDLGGYIKVTLYIYNNYVYMKSIGSIESYYFSSY